MSKQNKNRNNLGPLQKRIILCLAEKGPQTMNRTKENIMGHYKPTWQAFKSLQKKRLIRKVRDKDYKGRKYSEFWLTFDGVILSILEGESRGILSKHATGCLPKNEETERLLLTIELSKVLDRRWLEHLYFISRKKEELEPRDVLYLTVQYGMIQGITLNEGIKQVRVLMNVLKKYPKYHEKLMDIRKDMAKVMQEIKEE